MDVLTAITPGPLRGDPRLRDLVARALEGAESSKAPQAFPRGQGGEARGQAAALDGQARPPPARRGRLAPTAGRRPTSCAGWSSLRCFSDPQRRVVWSGGDFLPIQTAILNCLADVAGVQ
jgi:hypothetical protein